LKFQAVAEKTAKDARGYVILPHPVVCLRLYWQQHIIDQFKYVQNQASSPNFELWGTSKKFTPPQSSHQVSALAPPLAFERKFFLLGICQTLNSALFVQLLSL